MRSIFAVGALLLISIQLTHGIKTWDEFKIAFNKQYSTPEEESAKKENFLKSLQWIEENQGKNGLEFGINEFADLSHDEFNSRFSMNLTELMANAAKPDSLEPQIDLYETLPASFDWRSQIPFNSIENQGQCGACWAFASLFTVEAQLAIKKRGLKHLSKQELIDCSLDTYDKEYKNHGCHSGFAAEAFKYIIKHGVQEEVAYPYKMHETACQTKTVQSMTRYYINEQHQMRYNASDNEIMSVIKNIGPVTALVYSTDNAFKFLKGNGIVRNLLPNDKRVNHMISIVGWNHTPEGVNYWIIRNQWGEAWGDHGYMYLERNNNLLGLNFFVIYPVLH